MGNKVSNDYSIGEDIAESIAEDQWMNLMVADGPDFLDIRLSETKNENVFGHSYTIKIDNEIPRNCNLALFFPHHPTEKMQVLFTQGFRQTTRLNALINDRLAASKCRSELVKFAVGCNVNIFRFHDLDISKSNVYLFWAEINEKTGVHEKPLVFKRVPIFVETNCYMRIRNVFLHTQSVLLPRQDVKFEINCDEQLFCCEIDDRRQPRLQIQMLSAEKANAEIDNPISQEPVSSSSINTGFSLESDSDDDSLEVELILMPETPREN